MIESSIEHNQVRTSDSGAGIETIKYHGWIERSIKIFSLISLNYFRTLKLVEQKETMI